MSGPSDWTRPDPQRLIASLPLAVVLVAPDLSIGAVNPAAEQTLGQSARRLLGRDVRRVVEFVESQVAARLGESDAHLFARGTGVRIGGHVRLLDAMLAPVTGHAGWQMLTLHEPIGVEALGGERHGVDALPLRAPEVLAHEIKNPLAGIRGAAQLLSRGGDERQRELTDLITAEVDRVTKLIDQMQTLSRKQASPRLAMNVHEAVRRAIAVLWAAERGAPVVEEEFDPSLPPVSCSPDALVQIVLNLLANAADAADPAHPRVLVRTRFASGIRVHGAGGKAPLGLPIEIRVSDNGRGISPELHDHIFEPFVSSKAQGQGLGLALVQKLVRDMDGRVTHDRDERAGLTHFRVHLPMAHDAAPRVKAEAA